MSLQPYPSVTEYIQTVVDDLKRSAPRSSGALARSIEADIEFTSTGYSTEISMLDYGYFQDKGVNGFEHSYGSPYSFGSKRPPAQAFSAYRGFEFAIAYNIFKNGLKPKNWIQPSLDRTLDGLADVTVQDLWDYFVYSTKDDLE